MNWLKNILKKPELKKKKILTTDIIRIKIESLGWMLREIPIRQGNTVGRWRLIATKEQKSIALDAVTLEQCMLDMGRFLGAISSNE